MSIADILNDLSSRCIAPMPCICDKCVDAPFEEWTTEPVKPPIVFLPLMTKPTREVEKGTKCLPEVWKPNG